MAYWRVGYPRSEGLVFSFGLSPQEVLSGFREGRFSLAADLFPADVEALRRDPEYASSYREVPSLITYYAAFNTHRGPLVDRALRQRLVQAVQVKHLVRQTLGRLALPAHGFIPPGLLGHEPAAHSRAQATPAPEAPSTPGGGGDNGSRQSSLLRTVCRPLPGADRRPDPAGGYRTARDPDHGRMEGGHRQRQRRPDRGPLGSGFSGRRQHGLRPHSEGGYLGRVCGTGEIEEIIAREALLIPLFHEQAYRFARPEVEGLSVSLGSQVVAYEDLRVRG